MNRLNKKKNPLNFQNRHGASMVGALMGLGLMGFMVAVLTTGMNENFSAMERIKYHGELEDLRDQLQANMDCRLSCEENKALLAKSVGKWLIRADCKKAGIDIWVKIANKFPVDSDATLLFKKARRLNQTDKLFCDVRVIDNSMAKSKAAVCPAGQYMIGYDHKTMQPLCK